MSTQYTVIPLSAKTGKPVRKPKKGQKVIYGVRGPRGGITVIRKEPQKFYKTDLEGLNKVVSSTKKKNFIVYEQKTRQPKRDKEGKIMYRTDAEGVEHKLYETKITFARPTRKQKPLLYGGGKKLRDLDLGFKTGNYESVKKMRSLTLIKPNAPVYEQILKGRTLKQAVSNIQINVNMAKVRKEGFAIYYNVFMKIFTPTGELIKVPPVAGSFRDSDTGDSFFDGSNFIPLKKGGNTEMFGRNEIPLLANLHSKMSRSLRYALKNIGYTFSSLAVLDQIARRNDVLGRKLEKRGDEKGADKAFGSSRGLFFGHNRKKYFVDKKTKLTLIKGKYKVILYVKFEMMWD